MKIFRLYFEDWRGRELKIVTAHFDGERARDLIAILIKEFVKEKKYTLKKIEIVD